MADWKQITARIRRARGSRDPAGQLGLLYEKTGDAMVAFELGRHFEITKDSAKALHWYLTSFSKFRRGEWKTKAREAVIRLGGELPSDTEPLTEPLPERSDEAPLSPAVITMPDPTVPFEQTAVAFESLAETAAESSSSAASAGPESADETKSALDKKHRRRGRRGGRNRRKVSSSSSSENRASARPSARARAAEIVTEATAEPPIEAQPAEILPPRVVDSRAIPRIPIEPIPDSGAPAVKGRFGDPGLASRPSLCHRRSAPESQRIISPASPLCSRIRNVLGVSALSFVSQRWT